MCKVSGPLRKSSSTLAVEPPRVARRCTDEVACQCAIFEIGPCDESDFLAYAHTRLEPPVQVEAVPKINPCPDSNGFVRPGFEGRLRRASPPAPPSASRGVGQARLRDRELGTRRVACVSLR